MIFLTTLFVLTRIFYYFLGLRFDASPLGVYNQYLDPLLLRNDLLRSLFYLREQPPGFNLVLGLFTKWSPFELRHSFQAMFLLVGWASILSLYLLMRRLQVRPGIAIVMVSVFLAAPSTVLYENWLFYAYPVLFLLNLAALQLHRFLTGFKIVDGAIFFGALALTSSFHSMFHLFWFLLFLLMLLLLVQTHWKKVAIAALVPASLLIAISAKNLILFGDWTPGRQVYQTTNAAILTSQLTPASVIDKLIAEGKVTRILKMSIYHHVPDDYRDLVQQPALTGVPALDESIKSTGAVNWNSVWMARIGLLYNKDAITLNHFYPQGSIKSRWANLATYFFPAENVDPFTNTGYRNMIVLKPIFRWYDYLVSGQSQREGPPWLSWLIVGSCLLFGIYVILQWTIRGLKGRSYWSDPSSIVVLFLMFNILYTATVSIILSHGDQNRYRDAVSGQYLILFALLINSLPIGKLEKTKIA